MTTRPVNTPTSWPFPASAAPKAPPLYALPLEIIRQKRTQVYNAMAKGHRAVAILEAEALRKEADKLIHALLKDAAINGGNDK